MDILYTVCFLRLSREFDTLLSILYIMYSDIIHYCVIVIYQANRLQRLIYMHNNCMLLAISEESLPLVSHDEGEVP